MSDDLNDEQILLASAYLDGDVTSDERAQVEADPQLLAEVEQLRTIRSALADTPTTAISTREQHLAAALGAWDRLSDAERSGDNSGGIPAVSTDPAAAAGAATVTAPTALDDRRNKRAGQRNSGWMLTAAAILLVFAGGGLIARGIINSSSDDSTDATASIEIPAQREELSDAAADESFDAEPVAEAPAELAADAEQVEAGIDTGSGRPDEPEQIDTPELLAQFAKEQLQLEASTAGDSAVAAESAEAPEAAPEEVAEEPADAAADSVADDDVTVDSTSPSATERDFTCGLVDRIIGELEYGPGIFPVPAAVGVNADETEVIAFRVDTCEIVARAALDG